MTLSYVLIHRHTNNKNITERSSFFQVPLVGNMEKVENTVG